MKSLPTFRSLLEAWTSNRWIFVSSLVVVPATVILLVVSATQPSIIVDTLTPGGNSSESAEDDKDSPSTDSGGPGSEAPSSSPSSAPNLGGPTSSGGSTTGTSEPTPFVESASQAEAKQAAAVYLNQEYQYFRPLFSRVLIIQMLRDDGYTLADATYAAGAVRHDWSEEAAIMANDLIGGNINYFSRSGLISELRSENFTSSEASYAAGLIENSYPQGFYWATFWLEQASSYLNAEVQSGSNPSEIEASQILRSAGFTSAEVTEVLAMDYSEYSWQIFAESSAFAYYYDYSGQENPSPAQVENYLRGRGFTQSQIDYAMGRLEPYL